MPVAAPRERARLVEELAATASIFGADDVTAAIATIVERRDAATNDRIAALRTELDAAVAEFDSVCARRVQREEHRDALLRWADWCEAQPDEAREGVTEVADATRTVERLSTGARAAGRALDDVLEQQATAEAALEEARMEVEAHSAPGLAESDIRQELERARAELAAATGEDEAAARRRVDVLHRTLAVRAEPRSRDDRHKDAVTALARQAEALEARLAEAVSSARARADEAVRALAQAEQVLERLHHRERGRGRRLRDALEELPSELRPREEGDLLELSGAIAEALRLHAEELRPEVDELAHDVERLSAVRDELYARIQAEQARLGHPGDDDVVAAVRELIELAPVAPAVLDEPLLAGQWPAVLADLADLPPSRRVLLLTDDRLVLDWAIDLPDSVGGVRTDAVRAAADAGSAAGAESLQFRADPADARRAGDGAEPIISIDRLRAFAHRSPSEPRSDDRS